MPTTYPVWPESLPDWAVAESYQELPEANVVEFAPEVGPPLRRRRTSISTMQVNVELFLEDCDWNELLRFWRDDCAEGATRFSYTNPRTGVEHEYIFMQPPVMSVEGNVWRRVAMVLREMP